MSLAQSIKEQDFFKNLVEKKERGTLSNSILFFCDDEQTAKVSQVLTALMLQYPTFELFDENSVEFAKILNGADIDNRYYQKNNEKLLVSDSNEIVSEVFIKPVNFDKKIFVINNFDVSTTEAQNKLLKVLEEPPKNVYFLLSAKRQDKVLPTIKSRCDKIVISPLSEQEISKYCQNKLACILGNGFLGRTIALDEDDNLKSLCDFAVSIFTEMKSSKDVLNFSKNFANFRGKEDLILEVLSLCVEDMIKQKCESEALCKFSVYEDEIKNVEAEFTIAALCEIEKLISSFREKVDFNANATVLIDNFLLKILEVKYLCK